MPTLTHLALLDGGCTWHVVFTATDETDRQDYVAFCRAIPLGEREALPHHAGSGWRVQASGINAHRLARLFPDFPARLQTLRRQLELF